MSRIDVSENGIADDQLEHEGGTGAAEPEKIGETGQPDELAPGTPAAKTEEHTAADAEEERVQQEQAGDRPDRHGAVLPIEIPMSSCQRT